MAPTAISITCSGTQRLARSLTCWTNRLYNARNRISLLRYLNRPTLAPTYPISDRFIQSSKITFTYLFFLKSILSQHTNQILFSFKSHLEIGVFRSYFSPKHNFKQHFQIQGIRNLKRFCSITRLKH